MSTTGRGRSPGCCSTPPTAATSGARSECPRTSSRRRGRRSSTRWSTPSNRNQFRSNPPLPLARDEPDPDARSLPRPVRAGLRKDGLPEPEIPLARPELGAREEELVLEVMRSGSLSLGPMLGRFEHALAAWLGVEDVVAVSSGTAALHLGVRALGWGPGDEVVTSPLSFVASANCLLYEGATPVFCDVDPETLDLDPRAADAAIGERTAGLLPVDIFGYPADLPALSSLAAQRGLGLLEDGCQAFGALDAEGVRVGARGAACAFAFYANKQITTGEGGALVPPTPGATERVRSERNQGRAADMGRIEHDRLGYNYRLTDLSAAIGLAQLERADKLLARRARVAGMYRERLEGVEGLTLPMPDRGAEQRSWFVYVVGLPD